MDGTHAIAAAAAIITIITIITITTAIVTAVVLHPPLHNRLGPALQRVVQAREERVQPLVPTQMLQKCAAGRQAELRTGSRR